MSKKKRRKNSNYHNNPVKTSSAPVKNISKNTVISIVCVTLVLIIAALSITFCVMNSDNVVGKGACEYFETRNTDGRDLKYVKITVKNHGSMVLMLDATTAPITVENFMNLVNDGFYDGITFHRIIENFMIQGGDPDGTGNGGAPNKIKGEFSANGVKNDISHKRGVISMARSNAYNSASSQFFICNADSTDLDGNYAAFGYVIAGMDVVDSITKEGVKYTDGGVIKNKAKQPVITSIVEITEKQALSYAK